MSFLVGVGLALAVSAMATVVGLDRERSFYTTVTMVVAHYYALFAVLGGSAHALLVESMAMTVFLVAAIVGFKVDMRVVAVALVAHGVFDLVHGRWIENAGVPSWWPLFCMAFDVTAGAYLAVILMRRREDRV